MKTITFETLKNHLFEAEENFENEAAEEIMDNLSMFSDITFSKKEETDDYIVIVVNANDPEKARKDLCSYKFSHATGLIIEPIRRTKGNGWQLAVYDEDGDHFDRDVIIQVRRGGEFNAGVGNEINFANILQNVKTDTIVFKDKNGKKLVLKNVESVRDCSKDPGSRTGNRADTEIIADGKPFRISLKKDSAYKVAGLIKKFARESYKIGKIVRQFFNENGMPFEKTPYITIPIKNPELYRWCVFGNDMQKNGAVIQSTISKDDVIEQGDRTIIYVDQIVSPDEDDDTLMKEFPVYMLLAINRRGGVEVRAAVIGAFGRRYYRDDLKIAGVNESQSEKKKMRLGIFYGYHIYDDYNEADDIFYTKYTIKDYGLKGMAYIGIVSTTDDEIMFKDLKYNEMTDCYEPDGDVRTVHIAQKEPCMSRKRKGGFGMENIQ